MRTNYGKFNIYVTTDEEFGMIIKTLNLRQFKNKFKSRALSSYYIYGIKWSISMDILLYKAKKTILSLISKSVEIGFFTFFGGNAFLQNLCVLF